jgi:lipopolysaccharide transport system ATP-binding protein
MSELAISARGLGKQYRIGGRRLRYKTMRDTIVNAASLPLRLIRRSRGPAPGANAELFWALRSVSFEVRSGELIGIIGRNGAGKSTLLKILSRITEPTEGYADIHGRVSSLLEVGTGFHAELTGRENLYLNGAILGMRKSEIDRKFDEIVAFAEVERFIDMPVKHFSSGMYLRLAFAVAAHLQPEILIVDEVLAVGDVNFQKKCLNKMEDVGKGGRTVIFVSHNMPAVARLCQRVILLDRGTVSLDGSPTQVVSAYLTQGLGTSGAREFATPSKRGQAEIAGLHAVRLRDEGGRVTDVVDIRRPIEVEMEYEVFKGGHVLIPYFGVDNEDGITVFHSHDSEVKWRRTPRAPGRYVSRARIPGNFLSEGTMFVTAAAFTIKPSIRQFYEEDAVAFQVVDSLEEDSARGDLAGHIEGVVRPLLPWATEYRGATENASQSAGLSR